MNEFCISYDLQNYENTDKIDYLFTAITSDIAGILVTDPQYILDLWKMKSTHKYIYSKEFTDFCFVGFQGVSISENNIEVRFQGILFQQIFCKMFVEKFNWYQSIFYILCYVNVISGGWKFLAIHFILTSFLEFPAVLSTSTASSAILSSTSNPFSLCSS